GDDEDRGDADRQGGEEQPAPAPVVGDPAAGDGPGDRGDAEDGTHQALVLPALPGRDDVADDRLGQRHEGAHAQALHGATGDEGPEVGRQAADDRADQEDDEATEVELAAAEDVGELADDRDDDRRDQHG